MIITAETIYGEVVTGEITAELVNTVIVDHKYMVHKESIEGEKHHRVQALAGKEFDLRGCQKSGYKDATVRKCRKIQ